MSKLKDLNLNQILSKVNIKFKLVDIIRHQPMMNKDKKRESPFFYLTKSY